MGIKLQFHNKFILIFSILSKILIITIKRNHCSFFLDKKKLYLTSLSIQYFNLAFK
jgi:hypothetical protein